MTWRVLKTGYMLASIYIVLDVMYRVYEAWRIGIPLDGWVVLMRLLSQVSVATVFVADLTDNLTKYLEGRD